MKVLVTGGAGYIGSHAAKALTAAGFKPIVYDNLVTGHRRNVQWGPLVIGDLSDATLLRSTIQKHDVKAVLHFAASASTAESIRDPRKYYSNNLVNSIGLFDAMLENGIQHTVFSSTCAVYGDPQSHYLDEDHPQLPVNPYGETKLAIEHVLRWYGRAYGLKSVCLRYFNAAGADRDRDLGECHDPETHLIPLIIEAAFDGTRPVTIFGTDYPTPDGSAVRDYVHVSDLAEAHVSGLLYLLNGGPSIALNLGTGRGHSIFEVIKAVEHITGRPIPTTLGQRREGDPPRLVASAEKATRELGWTALTSFDDIIRTTWNFRLRPRLTMERFNERQLSRDAQEK